MEKLAPNFKARRRYPRRAYSKSVAILHRGSYQICAVLELGEGGLSFSTAQAVVEKDQVVASFQIPGGSYAAVRATVANSESAGPDSFTVSLEFVNLSFSDKRLIRSFVASRAP